MRVQFVTKENAPERLVCEAELIFDDTLGPLTGMKLVGFCLWRSPEGEVYVTFPERHVHLTLGASPQAEPHQLHAGQGPQGVVEDELRLAHEAFGGVLLRHELHTHLFLQSGSPAGERTGM